MCIFVVLTLFLNRFGAFTMRLLLKVYFFLRVWHLCLAQAYFFYALGTCVLCRCIYFTRVWKSDLHVYCECIFLPAHCAFFWKAHFWTAPWKQKSHFCCKWILAAHVFLRSSVLLIKTVRVSTGFGNFKASALTVVTQPLRTHLSRHTRAATGQTVLT